MWRRIDKKKTVEELQLAIVHSKRASCDTDLSERNASKSGAGSSPLQSFELSIQLTASWAINPPAKNPWCVRLDRGDMVFRFVNDFQ